MHYLRSLFGQTVHVLDSMPSGAAATTITATANTLQLGISEKLGIFIEYNATVIAAIIIAFTYSWSLTLVMSSTIVFILIVLAILLPFILRGYVALTKAETKAASVASEAFSAIRMIMSCGAEDRTAAKYTGWVQKARQAGQNMSPLIATQTGLMFFSLQGAFALAFWYGTKSYYEGRVDDVGTVIVVLMSAMLMV
jgi:ABC-type multidrug transport system fused ATPase/permease subunit